MSPIPQQDAQPLFVSGASAEMEPPEVTVMIPLYNYARLLPETLGSVLGQTLEKFDLLIVDDASTDDSAAVAKAWLEKHARRFRKASLWQHRQNGGLAASRNTGFQLAETPFVFPLDADNLIYPSCLKKLSAALKSSRAAFAYSLVERFFVSPAEPSVDRLMHLHAWDVARLWEVNRIDAMVLLRKSIWQKVGGYNRAMPAPGWEDYDLWFRIARIGGYGLQVHQILARYRVHQSSMLQTVTNQHASKLTDYMRREYPELFVGC